MISKASNPIEIPFDPMLLMEILDSSGTPIFVKNRQLRFVMVNQPFADIFGIDRADILGKNDFDLCTPEEAVGFAQADEKTFETRQPVEYEETITDANSATKTIKTHKNVIETTSGELLLVGSVHDITELRRTQTKLEDAVNHLSTIAHSDALTGLANRLQFESELENLIADHGSQEKSFSVLFIDLNGFKVINDTAGHHAGDEILRACAHRLRNQLRKNSTIARIGGDEFLILLPDTDASSASLAIERIKNSLQLSIDLKGSSWNVSCSIGVAVYPENGTTGSELIRNADFAMYEAKQHKRNDGITCSSSVKFYCSKIGDAMERRRTIESALNFFEYSNDIEQYYQPIVFHNGTNYQIKGFESLARWTLNGINISPDEFIPILDKSGGIVPFGYKIIESACEFLSKIDDDQFVSVNLTHQQILDKDFCDIVTSTIRAAGIDTTRLAFELTEQDANIDQAIVSSVFKKLKRIGVQTMIDDFGSGYSTLGRIGNLPVDTVKIDKSIVSQPRLFKPVLNFVRELGLSSIVEGIETAEVAENALAFGAGMLQGNFFGQPQPADYDWNRCFRYGTPSAPRTMATRPADRASTFETPPIPPIPPIAHEAL